MPSKGDVEEGSAIASQFELSIPGMPNIFWTRIGEVTVELIMSEQADQTWQTTGVTKPSETDADQYVHHEAEWLAMQAWFVACQTGAPLHKKVGTMHLNGADGQPVRSMRWQGITLSGWKVPELDAGGDGASVRATWMMKIDAVLPL